MPDQEGLAVERLVVRRFAMSFYSLILAFLLALALPSASPAAAPATPASEVPTLRLAVPHSLPLIHQRQVLSARITYRGAAKRRGILRFSVSTETTQHPIGPAHPITLTPGMDELTIAQPWTPNQAGRYTLSARWEPAQSTAPESSSSARQTVTVVCRPLHFHYWSTRPSLQVITEGMMNQEAQLTRWSDRGVIALRWRAGLVAYKRNNLKTPEQLAAYWTEVYARGWPGAVIDELSGSAGDIDTVLGHALVEARRRQPGGFLAVYTVQIGAGPHVEALRAAADRVLVETYQTGAADGYRIIRDRYQAAIDAGLGQKTLAALALGKLGITTPQELRRQLHFVRYTFPAMPGVAFFGNMEPLDPTINELLQAFYIQPVLRAEVTTQGQVRIENIGATDAPAANVELIGLDASAFVLRVPPLRAGEHWLTPAPANHVQPRTSYADTLVVLGPPLLWDREPPELRPGATTPWSAPQTPVATFAESFEQQPELDFAPATGENDASADKEQVAFCDIPTTQGHPCQLEFDLQTIRVGYYGRIEIGCAERNGRSSLNLVFRRSDHDRAVYVLVHFCNADGLVVFERAAFPFQAAQRYHLKLRCEPGRYLRLAIENPRQETLWDTGEIPVYGKATFDRLRFVVRGGPDQLGTVPILAAGGHKNGTVPFASQLRWDPQQKALLLHSAAEPKYVLSAYVDNLTMRYY